MAEQELVSFLDVPSLLEQSQPRARTAWLWYGGGVFLLLLMTSSFMSGQSAAGGIALQALSSLLMLGVVAAMGFYTWSTVRGVRLEQKQLEAVEELLQLRRWPEAAAILSTLLSQPTRTPQGRLLGLMFLMKVLSRYGRYADAGGLCEYLLSLEVLDSDTSHALKLERAMAMLHEDRLFDVDKAIGELKRSPQAARSSGLALVEMYRDVKTGHQAEALELFNEKLPMMRRQLGHRVADAYAMMAKAHDSVGKTSEAQEAWEKATLLCPAVELQRRYGELEKLAGKYTAAPAPAEAA